MKLLAEVDFMKSRKQPNLWRRIVNYNPSKIDGSSWLRHFRLDLQTFMNYPVVNVWVARQVMWFSRKLKSAIYVIRRQQQVHLSPIFWVKEQKYLLTCTKLLKHSNHPFQNWKHFRDLLNRYLEIVTRTQPKFDRFMWIAADRK